MSEIFKDVSSDLIEEANNLDKKYNESVNITKQLEEELTEAKINIAKLEVEDILKKDFSLFYSDFLENTPSLDTIEKEKVLNELYFKIVKSINKELIYLIELQKLLKEDVPSNFEELEPYTNILLDYKLI